MAEYIGSRISLISKRDIRYVGTLHEISSESSTVALEQVKSFGTEGRNPEDEVPASDNVYEYIVFRGSDVKDLRIEKEPEKPTHQPQVPDDPAILGNARPTATPSAAPQAQNQQPQQISQPSQQQQPQQRIHHQQHPPQGLPRFQQQPYFPNYYPPQRFGPLGPQGLPPHAYAPMPYGSPPPGWYPPPGQNFTHPPPGHFYPPPMGFGAPGQAPMTQGPPLKSSTPVEPSANDVSEAVLKQDLFAEKPTATVKLPSANTTPVPPTAAQNGPTPPIDSKPNVSEALAPPAPTIPADIPAAVKKTPIAPKSVHIMPAVPILSPAVKAKVPVNGVLQSTSTNVAANTQASSRLVAPRPTRSPTKSLEDANRDASAAVAAAMAKLPPATAPKKQTNGESAIDNLTNKVNEMRTHDNIRNSKQPGTGGYAAGHRGGRGSGYRGGRQPTGPQTKRIEVPETDYDFAKANAKFNKQDLVKEAIATGSPVGSPIDRSNDISADAAVDGGRRESEHSVVIPAAAGYTKKSFFDNISSESKDRDDAAGRRLGGREFRSEEQKKNLETFGQGSVDGYRGGFRGRNRGRGYRGGRGRSSLRGRGAVAAES